MPCLLLLDEDETPPLSNERKPLFASNHDIFSFKYPSLKSLIAKVRASLFFSLFFFNYFHCVSFFVFFKAISSRSRSLSFASNSIPISKSVNTIGGLVSCCRIQWQAATALTAYISFFSLNSLFLIPKILTRMNFYVWKWSFMNEKTFYFANSYHRSSPLITKSCTELSNSQKTPWPFFARISSKQAQLQEIFQFTKATVFSLLSKIILPDVLCRERINIISIYDITFWFFTDYSVEIKEEKLWLLGWNCRLFRS